MPIPPPSGQRIIPAAIAESTDKLSVRTATVFAMPFGTAKPDRSGELVPVERIKTPKLRLDRHRVYGSPKFISAELN